MYKINYIKGLVQHIACEKVLKVRNPTPLTRISNLECFFTPKNRTENDKKVVNIALASFKERLLQNYFKNSRLDFIRL